MVANMLPTWVKTLCRSKQETLRTVADLCQLVHDLFTWRHPGSQGLVMALLVLALVCEVLSTRVLAMLTGSGVLLACSPVLTGAQGLVAYAQWRRQDRGVAQQLPPRQNHGAVQLSPPTLPWGMRADYEEGW
eukprot:CAMPEP_0179375252 /NCGR_PEP_ID=MMETSP0797-20121207/87711_1 /TAXON_ID=47934 /ORGANISM="Dinophysis acuminata, Strain DAEP01" /LENGTH=131 /DNA_ID=CAMNT_0021091261 /DNA_START=1 /DNA_END=393 /DNA_ORIENTATION=+